MTVAATFTRKITVGDKELTDEVTVTCGTLTEISETIPLDSTDLAFALAFAAAKLKCIVLRATAAIKIEVNSSSAPDLTISLAAGGRFEWFDGSGITNPFTGVNVTAIYVTSGTAGTGAASDLTGYVGVDPT